MLLLRLFAVLLLSYSAVYSAQDTGKRYTVSGSVVNSVTGEPIRRALVTVGGTLTFTGADGRFEAQNVPESTPMVSAQKPGYFDCAERCHAGGAVKQIDLHSDKDDVLLKLTPEAKIQGHVVDDTGEPVSNIQVSAEAERIFNGRKQLQQVRGGMTDENGNYEITELQPGSYRIETEAHPTFFAMFMGKNSPRPEMYPRRFYPDTGDESAALMLDVKGGQTAEADFTLKPVPAFRISGSIAPGSGGTYVTAEKGQGDGEGQVPFQIRPGTNQFIIPYIAAGPWRLHFMRTPMMQPGQAEPQQLYAEEDVNVASADIKNLQVLMEPLPSVSVEISGGSAEDAQQLQVQFIARDGSRGMYQASRQRGPESPLQFLNVRPGRYGVVVWTGNQCVDTITAGNVDLTRDDFVVSAGAQSQAIQIGLGNDCATLQVSVRQQELSRMMTVILLSRSRKAEPLVMGGTGSFAFSHLAPGDYEVFAFSNADGLEYANPEVMRQFSGQEITLEPGQQATVTVNVIERGEK